MCRGIYCPRYPDRHMGKLGLVAVLLSMVSNYPYPFSACHFYKNNLYGNVEQFYGLFHTGS